MTMSFWFLYDVNVPASPLTAKNPLYHTRTPY